MTDKRLADEQTPTMPQIPEFVCFDAEPNSHLRISYVDALDYTHLRSWAINAIAAAEKRAEEQRMAKAESQERNRQLLGERAASESRLAAAQEALRKCVLTLHRGFIECHGDKCRQSNCLSCYGNMAESNDQLLNRIEAILSSPAASDRVSVPSEHIEVIKDALKYLDSHYERLDRDDDHGIMTTIRSEARGKIAEILKVLTAPGQSQDGA